MSSTRENRSISRRGWLQTAAGSAAALAMARRADSAPADTPLKGRINHSVVQWCFADYWNLDELCQRAKKLGCKSVELVEPKDFPILKKHGLVCAITPNGMPGAPFIKGLNNLKYHDEVITRTKEAIDANSAAGFPNVIAFNGFKWRDAEDPSSGEISLEEGAKNTVAGLKKLAAYGEHEAEVTIVDRVIDAASSTFGVRLTLPNDEAQIPSGLKCSVRFDLDPPPAALARATTETLPDRSWD